MTERLNGYYKRFIENIREYKFAYAFFLPTLVYLLVILWLPFLYGIYLSFHKTSLMTGQRWVGLENYIQLFTSEVFLISLRATVIFLSQTFIHLTLGLAAAVLVNQLRKKIARTVVSGVFLLAYTMPPLVTGTLWLYIADPNYGALFTILVNELHLLEEAVYWNANGADAMTVITLVAGWSTWPFIFLIILASLEGIPDVYYESAQIYGANRLQSFLYITLPQLKTAILVALSLRIVWNISEVSQPLQLTQGGPGFETSVLGIFLYRRAFGDDRFGIAFVIGLVMFMLALVFILLFIRWFKQDSGVSAA